MCVLVLFSRWRHPLWRSNHHHKGRWPDVTAHRNYFHHHRDHTAVVDTFNRGRSTCYGYLFKYAANRPSWSPSRMMADGKKTPCLCIYLFFPSLSPKGDIWYGQRVSQVSPSLPHCVHKYISRYVTWTVLDITTAPSPITRYRVSFSTRKHNIKHVSFAPIPYKYIHV